MSYTIFYRSLFVKTRNNKYLPIVESGDNNVWECDNKRRARSWHNSGWVTGENYLLTADEIMQKVEDVIQSVKNQYVGELTEPWDENCTTRWTEKDVENRFGYFDGLAISGRGTHTTTAQQIRNFYKRGIERAVPIEEIGLDVHWCTEWPHYEHRYTHSEEELLAAIKEGMDGNHQPWVGFSSSWDAERILDRQAAERVGQRRPVKERATGYVVTINGNYITKTTPRRFFSNYYLSTAHIYTSRSSAEKLSQRIQRSNYPSSVHEVRKNSDGRWELAA